MSNRASVGPSPVPAVIRALWKGPAGFFAAAFAGVVAEVAEVADVVLSGHNVVTRRAASCASGAYASGKADACTRWQITPMSPVCQPPSGFLRIIALRNVSVA